MKSEKIKFLIQKILSVLLIVVLLFAFVVPILVYCVPFIERIYDFESAWRTPLLSCFWLAVCAAFAESGVLMLVFLAIHFIVPVAIGVLSHLAYVKRKKYLRTIVYWILVAEIVIDLITTRFFAALFAVLLQLVVRFMIPFWMPYREKTIYDWEW